MSLTHLKKLAPSSVLALTVIAAACGGGAKTVSSTSGSSAGTATTTPQAPPGVSGTIAAVNGNQLEVQGASGQVTVNLASSTSITQTVAAAATDLSVGECVTATGTRSATTAPVAATSVSINELASSAANCLPGGAQGGGAGFFGGGGGFRRGTGTPGAGQTTRTTLSASQRAARAAQLAKVGIASGKVTTITGDTVDLAVPTPSTTSTTTAAQANRPRFSPSSVFTFGSSTTFSKTETATVSALTVNACVTAFGPSDTTGAVTATRITIRPPVNGSCSTGFAGGAGGGFGRFFGGGGGAGGAGA